MRIKNSWILLLVAILLFSCDKKRVFDEYKSVGSAWHKDSVVTFDLPVLDSTKKYNLLGNGFTDIKESKLFYKEDVKFKGKYKVHIKQAVRESGKIPGVEALEGITDVGFRIEQKD